MRKILWLAFFCLLIGSLPAPAQDAAALIAQGDELYGMRADPAKAREALGRYEEVLKLGARQYEALWKCAKALYSLGVAAAGEKEKLALFREGVQYAKRAVAANGSGVEGHFWLGVDWAKYGEARGVLKSLFLAGSVKEEMRRVLTLDENYEGAGAHRVLGRVYFKLPGIAGGSNKKARQHLERAVQLGPTNTLNLLYLAELYWEVGQKKEAQATLEQLLATAPDPRWLPETAADKLAAEKLLMKYRK